MLCKLLRLHTYLLTPLATLPGRPDTQTTHCEATYQVHDASGQQRDGTAPSASSHIDTFFSYKLFIPLCVVYVVVSILNHILYKLCEPQEAPLMGEVVISYPQAARQAKKGKRPLRSEMALLIVHGVLHLLGYDHVDSRQEDHMWARQDEILARVPVK